MFRRFARNHPPQRNKTCNLVGALEPWNFMTFHILGMSSSQLTKLIFFRGVAKNHQPVIVSVFVGLVETCRKPSFFPLTAAINCGFCPLMFTVSRQMFYLHPENVIACRILSGSLSHGLEKRSQFDDCPAEAWGISITMRQFSRRLPTVSSLTSSRFDQIEKGGIS